jgi:membrane-associated phospholipid phosphatase
MDRHPSLDAAERSDGLARRHRAARWDLGPTCGIKDLVNRPRPFEAHPQIHPLYSVHSSSFPAGHAATAFAGATLLAYMAPRASPLFLALAVAISYSRVYVGVHYPGDVIAGAAVGALVAGAVIAVLRLSPSPAVRAKFRGGSRPAVTRRAQIR